MSLFYVIVQCIIAILALRVKSNSLQEKNVPGREYVLIVNHHVKNIYNICILTRAVRKALNAISDETKLKFNLLCYF